MRNLFDSLDDDPTWRPEAPPSLDRFENVFLDFETTGLRWWDGDRPIGLALRTPDGKSRYLPWGHQGSANLDENVMRRWMQTELKGKRIDNQNVKFEIHMAREWGVDLEAMGCTVGDSSHWAALLDDHRKVFNLSALGQHYLGIGKIEDGLDKSRMADYSASRVAAYACRDVDLVAGIKEVVWPMLTAEDLHRVRELEERTIWVTAEMEKNAARLDLELLKRWNHESEREIRALLMDIFDETGIMLDPGSVKDKTRLFRALGIPILEYTDSGKPSFTDAVLKKAAAENPLIQKLRRIQRVQSLRAKYLVGDLEALSPDGLLRYSLHQLRSSKTDADDSYASGTVGGRFSSTSILDDEGCNIQQRIKVAKQRTMFGYDEDDDSHDDELYVIRKYHVADPGMLVLSSDMMQVEYRYFAHLAGTPAVLEAYRNDPFLSFHKHVWGMIKPYAALTYRQQKDLNFAKIYAAGLPKLAHMLGFITVSQLAEIQSLAPERRRGHPLLKEAMEVDRIYNKVLPEVKPLLKKASTLAEERGWVKTIMGRRSRFPTRERLHKALNNVIQGSCADINKQKLIELHAERKYTGLKLRFTLHDEVVGDVPDKEAANRVTEILNRQSFNLTVPILWETAVGPNWAECENLPNQPFQWS